MLDGNANNRNPISEAERETRERLGLGTSKLCTFCAQPYEFALSITKNEMGQPLSCRHDLS